jgi:hypothetical protein
MTLITHFPIPTTKLDMDAVRAELHTFVERAENWAQGSHVEPTSAKEWADKAQEIADGMTAVGIQMTRINVVPGQLLYEQDVEGRELRLSVANTIAHRRSPYGPLVYGEDFMIVGHHLLLMTDPTEPFEVIVVHTPYVGTTAELQAIMNAFKDNVLNEAMFLRNESLDAARAAQAAADEAAGIVGAVQTAVTMRQQRIVAYEGQNVLTIDTNAQPVVARGGSIQLYQLDYGMMSEGVDYTLNDTNQIVLAIPASAGDTFVATTFPQIGETELQAQFLTLINSLGDRLDGTFDRITRIEEDAAYSAHMAEVARDATMSTVIVDMITPTLTDLPLELIPVGTTAWAMDNGFFYHFDGTAWIEDGPGILAHKADKRDVQPFQGAVSEVAEVPLAIANDEYYSPLNGGILYDVEWRSATYHITTDETFFATGLLLGESALACFYDETNAFISAQGINYVNGPSRRFDREHLKLPADTRFIRISSYNSDPKLFRSTGTPLNVRSTIEKQSDPILEQIIEEYTFLEPVTSVVTTDRFFHYGTGNLVSSSVHDCTAIAYTDEMSQLYVTGSTQGPLTALAVYVDSNGDSLGNEAVGSNVVEHFENYKLTIPQGTAQVLISFLKAHPFAIAKRTVAVRDKSLYDTEWADKVVSVMGDGNVSRGLWFEDVEQTLGCELINNGVELSRVAKPNVSGAAVSMCDSVRIDSLSMASDVWVCGPLGVEDWFTNTPIGTINDVVNTTFYGALKEMAEKLQLRAPMKQIIWVTPHHVQYVSAPNSFWTSGQRNGFGTIADYADAVRNVARCYGIPVVDLGAECGWSSANCHGYLAPEGGSNTIRKHIGGTYGPQRAAKAVTSGLRRLEDLI